MRTALEAVKARNPAAAEQALQTMADSCARLTPEMMLAMLGSRQSSNAADAQMANDLMERMSDQTVASFVARSVTVEKGATERLAHALEVLVPEAERKGRILELAHEEAAPSEAGQEEGFEQLWQSAADMLTSYSDASFVSEEYGKELTAARAQALEVERVSDDPPERVHAWVGTVSESALQDLDLNLLRDLLRIEEDPALWEGMATIVVGEIERLYADRRCAERACAGRSPRERDDRRGPAGTARRRHPQHRAPGGGAGRETRRRESAEGRRRRGRIPESPVPHDGRRRRTPAR